MKSYFNTMPTILHAHSSTLREIDYAPISSETWSLLSHYAPSSRKTSSTLFHYAPLSSATLLSHSLHHGSSSSPSSKTTSPQFSSPLQTSRPSSSVPSASLTATSTTIVPAQTPDHTESLPAGPPIGLTVAVSVLLVILMTVAVMIWLVEVLDQKHPKKAGYKEESAVVGQSENVLGPIGLRISAYPILKEKNKVEHERDALNLFQRMMRKMVDFAVSRSRTELASDPEEDLLLPVQDGERVGSKRDQIAIDLESV